MIVHATVEYGAHGWGGIATAVDLAATATARAGIRTVVVCPGEDAARYQAAGGYTVRTMRHGGAQAVYDAADRDEPGRLLSDLLFDAIQEERGREPVDALVHNEELVHLLASLRSALWCRRSMAFSHGLAAREHAGRRQIAAQQDAFYRTADMVFVASNSQRREARASFPKTDIRVLPLPLELLDEELGGLPRSPVPGRLFAAGRAVRQKGFDLLLKALTLVDEDCAWELHLHLGHGDAEVEAECARLAQGLAGVTIRPWAARDELLAEIGRAVAVVVPSRFEPLGLMAAEALAAGAPVVASDVGGLAELVGGIPGTELVGVHRDDGSDPGALAAALRRVLARSPVRIDAGPRLHSYSVRRFIEALHDKGVT